MTLADWFILGGIVAIAVLDVMLIVWKRKTISKRFRKHGREVSAFAASWGVLGGHFWGPDMRPLVGWWASAGIMLGAVALVIPVHWFLRNAEILPNWWPLVYIPLYIPIGLLFWPQFGI